MFDSQNGKIMRQTKPMTSIAIMLALCQPCAAFEAIVQGMRIREKAALRNTIPPTSNSNYKAFRRRTMPSPRQGDGTVKPNFRAFRLFRKSVKASGRNMIGKMMHHMP